MNFRVNVDRERCKGCVLCVTFCPHGVLRMSKALNARGYHVAEVVNPEGCTGCKQCAVVCPDIAVEIYRTE